MRGGSHWFCPEIRPTLPEAEDPALPRRPHGRPGCPRTAGGGPSAAQRAPSPVAATRRAARRVEAAACASHGSPALRPPRSIQIRTPLRARVPSAGTSHSRRRRTQSGAPWGLRRTRSCGRTGRGLWARGAFCAAQPGRFGEWRGRGWGRGRTGWTPRQCKDLGDDSVSDFGKEKVPPVSPAWSSSGPSPFQTAVCADTVGLSVTPLRASARNGEPALPSFSLQHPLAHVLLFFFFSSWFGGLERNWKCRFKNRRSLPALRALRPQASWSVCVVLQLHSLLGTAFVAVSGWPVRWTFCV